LARAFCADVCAFATEGTSIDEPAQLNIKPARRPDTRKHEGKSQNFSIKIKISERCAFPNDSFHHVAKPAPDAEKV
jgi:hypothetical protein